MENVFECVRCTRKVIDEECYLMENLLYCRACNNTLQNDPDYAWIRNNVLWRLRQIEN